MCIYPVSPLQSDPDLLIASCAPSIPAWSNPRIAAMSHDVVAHIKAAERFIRGQVDLELLTLEAACASQLDHVSDLIRTNQDIDPDSCTKVFEYLKQDNGTFNIDQRKTLAKLAQVRCNTLATVQGGAAAADDENQDNHSLCNYYPDWLWSILKADNISVHNKLSHTASFLVNNLGIRHASANTKRLAVSIVQVASNFEANPEAAYQHVHDLQELIVRKRGTMPGAPTLKVFPKDPKDFWAQYPTAYSEAHPPVACRIDEHLVIERNCRRYVPTRSTNKQVNARKPATISNHNERQPVATPADVNAHTMQMMLKFMMGGTGAAPPMFGSGSQPSTLQFFDRSSNMQDSGRTYSNASGQQHGHNPSGSREIEDDAPIDAGSIPGVLQAPRKSSPGTDKMNSIRASIEAAVAGGKAAAAGGDDDDSDEESSENDDDKHASSKVDKGSKKGDGAKVAPKKA